MSNLIRITKNYRTEKIPVEVVTVSGCLLFNGFSVNSHIISLFVVNASS